VGELLQALLRLLAAAGLHRAQVASPTLGW
jgi:hypothetical protein